MEIIYGFKEILKIVYSKNGKDYNNIMEKITTKSGDFRGILSKTEKIPTTPCQEPRGEVAVLP